MSRDINEPLTKEQRKLRQAEELRKLSDSRGFTIEYQQDRETRENDQCRKAIAPATKATYDPVVELWYLEWRLSRNEPEDTNFAKHEPDPSAQTLKNFTEFYVTSRKKDLPSRQTVRQRFSCLVAEWEAKTCRVLPATLKNDVYNFIDTDLTQKYGLSGKPREKFTATKMDSNYLLRHLFGDDYHDYVHEIMRVYLGLSLSLFSGSGARSGAVVESSAYRGSNESLYYKHLVLNMKWSKPGEVEYWVTIDQEFLKGQRYNDEKHVPRNWICEQKILGRNFVFWLMAVGLADQAFKHIRTIDKLLEVRPPRGRESLSFEWEPHMENVPVFRMVTPQGPHKTKAMTFSSLRHHLMLLAVRASFRDPFRVHGIRGGIANKVDSSESRETRGQALDHQDPETFLQYQSRVKAVDIQAAFWDLEPNLGCLEMERSMAHHRDTNVPKHLSAMAIGEVENDPEMIDLKHKIADLTSRIDGRPQDHSDLVSERSKLYTQAAKKRRTKLKEFVKKWWESSYSEYIAGSEFAEQDQTCLFHIYRKYMPERSRLRDNLFTEASIHSDVGRQCLQDMVSLCVSEKSVAYYPGELPRDGRCPICSMEMASIPLKGRSKHILQCRRQKKNAAPYQQRYKNGKRAHRAARRPFLEFCYLCAKWFPDETDWTDHCVSHLDHLEPRCGLLVFRSTLVAPGFCPYCIGDVGKKPEERFQQWRTKATLINHIDDHLAGQPHDKEIGCPHPCCAGKKYMDLLHLRRHFFDGHSIEEPRPNCVARKRKWDFAADVAKGPEVKRTQLKPC
ncbi:hypothetical protein ACJ73_04303 [Blastomyces percursus]|uniref:Uncharacterized protein n=1 Tax=Blastomyces percursus TaxID=1658174 RepID=A0A1J9R759_9EURO|nr:hypothetical protein ACJ73_04303 [Blastomyces percursus]